MLKMATTDKLADVSALKKRFLALNRERLERTRSALRERQREFLDMLPLLFHANHPMLPGFISKQTPFGVSDYSPSKRVLDVAKRHVRSFDYKRRALPSYDIQAMFVMGSIGTVAYSDKSDLDIWLCHKPGIAGKPLDELRQKAREIEKAADQLDLEIHFFVMDAQAFKEGRHDNLSSESSGTAQHHLLLEEFYRTGLLLAGRYPLWWLVPPDQEAEYERYTYNLKHKRFIREDECIDFGGIPAIPSEEFFGAALWQLSKGIDSPYKSVLKLLLMEVYANEHPNADLLCQRFKRAIYGGETNLGNLDPYIMLYHKIEEYLQGRREIPRLELLRRCFYFKVQEKLSVTVNTRSQTWQRELMLEMVKAWDWSRDKLEMLDSREHWKIDAVAEERQVLVAQLTETYQFLSKFARSHTQLSLISQQDVNVLGRKLYAAFERKAGKIEIVNREISGNLLESHLGIHHTAHRRGEQTWLLHRDSGAEAGQTPPLKRARSAVELLSWCYFNNLIDNATVLTLQTETDGVTTKEVREILRCLRRHFPLYELKGHDMDALTKPPRVLKSVVFVNVGTDPLSGLTRQGKHLTTVKTDALSFSGLGENLALTFDQVLCTSWNEVLTYRYTGANALMECMCSYLQWFLQRHSGVTPFTAYSFSSSRGTSIAQRLEELFKDIVTCFFHADRPDTARYVLHVKHHYYIVYLDEGHFKYTRVDSQEDLLRRFSLPQPQYSPLVIDRHALTNSPLPALLTTNKPGVIQVYYALDGATAHVYVLDENGSLFIQQQAYGKPAVLLNQYTRFFRATRKRQRLQLSMHAQPDGSDESIIYYQIKKGGNRRWRIDRQNVVNMDNAHSNYFDVQVIGGLAEDNTPVFTFYCEGREFTSLEHGQGLYREVARHILTRRRDGGAYSLYITDIDLPPALHGGNVNAPLQTIHYLNYKKFIEEQLNQSLSQLSRATAGPSG